MKKPNKYKEPVAYYIFWVLFYAILLGIAVFAYQNILPYQAVVKKIAHIPQEEPTRIIQILWFRLQLSYSWMIGAIFWAILQGLQVGYLLFVESEKALDFIIKKADSKTKYAEKEADSQTLRFAKRKYNDLPLQVLILLQLGCVFAYVVEFFVNSFSFPLFNGSFLEAAIAFLALQWDKFDFGNLVSILLTLFAVELLVFSALLTYRVIEIFKESGAYKPKQNP